jgi:5'-3' exonuclease
MAIQFTSHGKPIPNGNLLIVDGLNLAFRWKHQGTTDFEHEYVRTVQSLAKSYNCGEIVILGDGGSNYRKSIDPEYKANRKERYAEQTPAEAKEFEMFLAEFSTTMSTLKRKGYLTLKYAGVEADDIAALICQNRENLGVDEIWMISSDKDWDLLVDEKISRFSTVTRKETTLLNWDEHYDFDPYYYLTYKALTGDKGDNVPGVDGVGPKRATQLIEQYGDVFDIMASLPLDGKYKYIQNLNEFGSKGLEAGVKLMDLTYDVNAAVLGHGEEIIGLVENYVSEDRL